MKFGALKIKLPNSQTREFEIDQSSISVGRAPGNNLIIEDTSVSRRHARLTIESGRLMIEDLGSANGTFVDSQRLSPNTPGLIVEGHVLRLGDVELQYIPPPPMEIQPPPVVTATPIGSPINISLVGPAQPVMPGSTTTAILTVQNRSAVVDELTVQVLGVPIEWVRLSKERVSLLPNAQEQVTITYQLPRRPEATATEHSFTVNVTSREHHASETAQGALKVLPYQSFTLSLQPQRSRRDFQLMVSNQGNASTAYRFSGSDDEQSLVYQFGQDAVSLQPGQSGAIPLRVAPKVEPKVGTRETRAFNITAAPLDPLGAEARAAGQLIIRPPIPVWLIPLMLALALLACVLGAVVYGKVCGSIGTNLPLCPSNAKPTINVFEATPNVIEKGGTIALKWDVSNADQVELTQPAQETLQKNGVKTYNVDLTTIFTLRATNAFGSIDRSITVNLKNSPPVIQSFKADPAVVTAGRSAQIALSWIVAGAEAVSIEGVQGVSGSTGSVQIDPPSGDKTFKLIATNAVGTVQQEITVHVSSAGCVLQSAAEMHEGPSDKYGVIDALVAGTSVVPVGRNATGVWLRVQANREGWVLANEIGCSGLNILDIAIVNPADIPPEPTDTPTPMPSPTSTPVPTAVPEPTDTPPPTLPPAALKVERFCNTGEQANHPTAEVEVPAAYKIVGGGAIINWTGAGSLLTASYPESLQKWVAAGKDHGVASPSSITVCALALFDPDDVWDVRIFDATSDSASHPFAQVSVPADYTMVGGGARVNWTGDGNLLTESFPNSLGSWEARSKDHLYPSPATITVSAIGIKAKNGNRYPRFPETKLFCRDSSTDQHISIGITVDAGYVLLSGGAIDHWSGAGNMLTASYPDSESSWAAAGKDHIQASPAYLTVCAIGFKPFNP